MRGVERYHVGVLPALAQSDPGSRIVVLRAPWQDYYDSLAGVGGLELATVTPPYSRVQRGLWQLLDGGLRGRPADLLHLGNVLPTPIGIRLPIVAMVHDVIEFQSAHSYDPLRRWARRRLVHRLGRRARVLVTPAEFTARKLTVLLSVPPERIVTVGIGIDPVAPAPSRHAEARDRAVVFVGGLDLHKRLDLAVTAVARLPGVELRIVSAGGPAQAGLRRLAEALGVSARVRWLGWLPDAEVRLMIANSAALLMPSDVEGFGLPALEAMQLGTPAVLSSGIPLAAEWERMGGPVFRAGDADDLASSLTALLDDPARRKRLGLSGMELAARYTWPAAAGRLYAVWRDVYSTTRSPAPGRQASL